MMAIIQKIKKSILNLSNIKRTTLLVLLFSVFLGLILPVFYAHGFIPTDPGTFALWLGYKAASGDFDILGGAAKDIANGIVYVLFGAITALTSFFLSFSNTVLQWVISPDFISVKFTDNPVVNLGWTTVRDFTNMLFILVLVIIALGSALRLREYEVKKLLPILIGIALLINFTPVICGFIIDASNIVMNTFLKGGVTSTGFLETAGEQVSEIKTIKEPSERLAIGIALSAFNVVGGIIFLLFALLFAVRYLALWILVILSPIAFFCYILPQTKEVWSKWWNQFIQWSIIGIPAAFFLYLTNIMIKNMSDTGGLISRPSREMAGLPSGATGFADLAMYLVPLLFLVIGFFVSIRTSAIGADKITAGFSGVVKTGGAWAGRKIGKRASSFVKERMPAKVLRKAERIAAYSPEGKWWKRMYAIPGWAVRKGAGAVATVTELEKKDITEAREKASKRTASANLNTIRDPLTSKVERIGALQAAIEKGQIRDMKKLGLEEEELESLVMKIGKQTIKVDPKEFSKIRDTFPHLAEKIGKGFDENVRLRAGLMLDEEAIKTAGFKTPLEAIVAGLSAKDIELMDKAAIHDEDVQIAMHKFWNGNQIAAAGRNFGREFIDEFQAFAEGHGRDFYLKPESFNPNVPNYLDSSGAQSLGFSSIGPRIKKEESATARAGAKTYKEQTLPREVNRENILEKDRKKLFLEEREIKPKKEPEEEEKFTGGTKPLP